MKSWLAALLAACACAAPAVADAPSTLPPVAAALQRYATARPQIEAELGPAGAAALHRRLFDDLELQAMPAPDGYPASDWAETKANVTRLDIEALDQLVAGTPAPLQMTPGLHEVLVPSRVDHTLQLVALYVPASVRPPRAPLAILLHGNPQTESELLGPPYFRRLAERTGTIIAAPYGRGIYDFEEPAATDVYDLLDTLQRTLPVDRGRTYLTGYSMGGFTVFKIGPRGGYRWAGVMCISGAILNSGVRPVSLAWREMRLYVVTGVNDTSIPTKYSEQTAGFLAGVGLPVSFYREPRGSHAVRTLVPSLERAWDDMHAGLTRPESVPVSRTGFAAPMSAPTGAFHP